MVDSDRVASIHVRNRRRLQHFEVGMMAFAVCSIIFGNDDPQWLEPSDCASSFAMAGIGTLSVVSRRTAVQVRAVPDLFVGHWTLDC